MDFKAEFKKRKNHFHIKSISLCLSSLNLVENLPGMAMAQVDWLGRLWVCAFGDHLN